MTWLASAATDFIPCSDPCNGGDVNYHLVASVETVRLLNYTYRGRLYSSGDGLKGGFDDATSFMGPTLRVRPGQSLWVKLTNNLTAADLGPRPPTVDDYWRMLQNPGESIKYQYYKRAVAAPALMAVDGANVPGGFDGTNLHLHGLDVAVHMFDPVGTRDPDAPHVRVDPGECYCYRFRVPDRHPAGMYWYHPHAHGSTAVQMWGGMMGLLYVEGPLAGELANYGIGNTREFVIWDPALQAVDAPTHDVEVDEFLMGQTTLSKIHPFTVNGQIDPTFATATGEVLHLRVLCGTVENQNTFVVYPKGREGEPWDDAAVDFWLLGADGVTYRTPRRKRILVMAGGQRYELLLRFDRPGTYVVSQQGIQGLQFFDMYGHPHDQLLATVDVRDAAAATLPTIDVGDMVFTPGYADGDAIDARDVVASEAVVFSMGAERDRAPFPQYHVNGRPYAPDRVDFRAAPGTAREYLLVNANHNAHPFHLHVNRFQVKEMGSELSVAKYPALAAVLDFEADAWRDTVVVPPNGRARIWVRYGNYTGKTVFHCHFLAHEDTGMMATLFIGPPDLSPWRWRDEMAHVLFGLGVGLAVATLGLCCFFRRGGATPSSSYDVVATLNDLKSKAMD